MDGKKANPRLLSKKNSLKTKFLSDICGHNLIFVITLKIFFDRITKKLNLKMGEQIKLILAPPHFHRV